MGGRDGRLGPKAGGREGGARSGKTRRLRSVISACGASCRVHRGLLLLAALFAAPVASAQGDTWFYPGGEPGVRASIGGVDLANASEAGGAVVVDPETPVDLSLSIAPPPNVTWRVKSVSVGLLVNGPRSEPPDALVRTTVANSTLPPEFTVVVNRSVELSSLKRVGAGTFLMHAQVRDVNDSALYAQDFYVRIPVGLDQLLTAQGATITAVSVATGYGFWSIGKDLKEMRDAWARHRKRREEARLDVIGRTEHLAEDVLARAGKPAAEAVDVRRDAQETERALGPVRWTATGLGLGGVGIAWAQFLGYVALDVTDILVTAMEVAAAFLTVALVTNAVVKRARARRAARAEADRSVTLVPEDASASRPGANASVVVQPADKRD